MRAMRELWTKHKHAWPVFLLFLLFAAIAAGSFIPNRKATPSWQVKRQEYRAYINMAVAAKNEGYYKDAIEALLFVVHTHRQGLPEWCLAAGQLAETYELCGDQEMADKYYLISAKYSGSAVQMRKSAAYYRIIRKAQETSNAPIQ